MNRILAILSVIGLAFVGLSAVILQTNDYEPQSNPQIFDGLTQITNVSVIVLSFAIIFIGGAALLIGVIASVGGR